MRAIGFGSRAFGVGLAMVFLGGCGGAQFRGLSLPSSRATVAHGTGVNARSWIDPNAKSGDLIYAVGGCGGSCILSYPKGTLVGAVTGYQGGSYFSANCSDNNGNVYTSDDTEVVEFAHGGTTPIATLSVPGTEARGCSVDPMTGNFAVVYDSSFVAVYAPGSTNPTSYNTLLNGAEYCGYDSSGNLYVGGYDGEASGLSELPRNGSMFTKFSLDQAVGQPGQVQWDGSYITYESFGTKKTVVSRLSISGSSASIVSQTLLKRVRKRLQQSWIYKGAIIAPYGNHGTNAPNIAIWRYPNGGAPTKRITRFGSFDKNMFNIYGVTISTAK